MLHVQDKRCENPRMQCVACGRWGRLFANGRQVFHGSCRHNKGGDHLAAKNGDNDVCGSCCDAECKRLAMQPRRP